MEMMLRAWVSESIWCGLFEMRMCAWRVVNRYFLKSQACWSMENFLFLQSCQVSVSKKTVRRYRQSRTVVLTSRIAHLCLWLHLQVEAELACLGSRYQVAEEGKLQIAVSCLSFLHYRSLHVHPSAQSSFLYNYKQQNKRIHVVMWLDAGKHMQLRWRCPRRWLETNG